MYPSLRRWLRRLFAPTPSLRRPGGRSARPLLVEGLEPRFLPTLYVVTTTLDILGDTTPGQLTLRDALTPIDTQHASGNAAAGTASNIIDFAIPGSGPQTIAVGSSGNGGLPALTHPVFLDGWSQGGRGYDGPPLIVLAGSDAGTADGLDLEAGNPPFLNGLGATGNVVTSNNPVSG